MRVAFEEAFYDEIHNNEKVIALMADSGTGLFSKLKNELPERCVDFGIAECNMIGAAAGLASKGFIPVVYGANNFLAYRAYEFIRNDLCLDNRNVKVVGLGAGVFNNTQGPTHHTLEDIAVLRVIPNLTLLSPGCPEEVGNILRAAIDHKGPVYIRLANSFESSIYTDYVPDFKIGSPQIVREGDDLTIFSTGAITGDVCKVVDSLKQKGINALLVNVNTIKPVDNSIIYNMAMRTRKIISVEEHSVIGGLGSLIAEILARSGEKYIYTMMGFDDTFVHEYGWNQDLKRFHGLSPVHIENEILNMIKI